MRVIEAPMPQFDFAQNLVPQLAWLALFFAILYFGIVQATLPRLARLMDERQGRVTGDIGAADMAKAEADRIHHGYEAEMAQAHAGAHAAIAEAKAQAVRETEARLGEANAALSVRSDRAFATLDAARGRALADLEQVAAEAAADIVARLAGDRPDEATARAAARAALAA